MRGYNLSRFLYTKRRCFVKERELRVVLQCYDPMAGGNRHYDLNNFAHREPLDELNPLHKWVHDGRNCLGRSEEHTSELQSHLNLVCRLLLEKKKKKTTQYTL